SCTGDAGGTRASPVLLLAYPTVNHVLPAQLHARSHHTRFGLSCQQDRWPRVSATSGAWLTATHGWSLDALPHGQPRYVMVGRLAGQAVSQCQYGKDTSNGESSISVGLGGRA